MVIVSNCVHTVVELSEANMFTMDHLLVVSASSEANVKTAPPPAQSTWVAVVQPRLHKFTQMFLYKEILGSMYRAAGLVLRCCSFLGGPWHHNLLSLRRLSALDLSC